jgi:cyclophilin family peptidyl-prolyl cis-trans isomerase
MKKRLFLALGAGFILSLVSMSCSPDPGSPDEVAVLETSYGRIVIEFYPQEAPRHVANFKKLAREGFFDGMRFHRSLVNKGIPIAIQSGNPNTIKGDPSTWEQGTSNLPTVKAEYSDRLHHVRGAVSAARKKDEPDSHTSQFFICASNYLEWDGQYTIFGKVIDGMNVVDSIVRAPVVKNSERPVDPVTLTKVYITKKSEVQ